MTFLTRRFALRLVALMCLVWPSPFGFAQDSYQTATVISVRQIRHMGSLGPSRFAHTIYFTVDFALRLPAESYCVGYETPVVDEVQDLLVSNGKDISVRQIRHMGSLGASRFAHTIRVQMRGKKLAVELPTGRRMKAELVKQTQC